MRLKDLIPRAVVVLLIGAAAYFVWHQYSIMINEGGGRWQRARLDVKILDQAATAYYVRHSHWPPSLETLVKPQPNGESAFIKDLEILIDPGGRPYQYDPKQIHPKSEKPLIWSEGPNPGEPWSKIRNWD